MSRSLHRQSEMQTIQGGDSYLNSAMEAPVTVLESFRLPNLHRDRIESWETPDKSFGLSLLHLLLDTHASAPC